LTSRLTIALPKGKLGEEALKLAESAGLPVMGVETEGRRLFFEFPRVRYLICRPTDVPTYVEYGAADMGIVGKDTLAEAGADVFELLDLKFGYCRFVVAVPEEEASPVAKDLSLLNHRRVATKFPRVAREFFASRGLMADIIKLHGNVELAPRAGLAAAIVDIVSTGNTLKENRLVPVAEVFSSTARLIANRVSYRMNNAAVQELVDQLRNLTEGERCQ